MFPQVFENVRRLLTSQIAVCHTPFDRVALARACEKYGLPEVQCTWLDSARVVRRAWQQFARSGYGLANITEFLGIVYQPHLAQEDARAAGEVVLRAVAATGMTVEEWVIRARKRISPYGATGSGGHIALEGNPEGPLAGDVAVFTGALCIPRREAAQMAANLGLCVAVSVNKETTLLIVGDQDLRKLAGHEKSSKHRKAEALIAEGQRIRILSESDFLALLRIEGHETYQGSEAMSPLHKHREESSVQGDQP